MGRPYVTTQRLRFCDTDQVGHVNNAVYAVMFEAGRAELLARLGFIDPAAGLNVVIARLEIDFLREMNWPGEVSIETEVARIGTKSIQLRQRLRVEDALVSRAVSIVAVIDTATRRSVPIEDAWRSRMEEWCVADGIETGPSAAD